MTPTETHQDWTPEEKSKILAEMRARVTAEDLLEYATDDSPLIPLDDLIRRMDEEILKAEAQAVRGAS